MDFVHEHSVKLLIHVPASFTEEIVIVIVETNDYHLLFRLRLFQSIEL